MRYGAILTSMAVLFFVACKSTTPPTPQGNQPPPVKYEQGPQAPSVGPRTFTPGVPVSPIQHNPFTITTNDPSVTVPVQQPVLITTTNIEGIDVRGITRILGTNVVTMFLSSVSAVTNLAQNNPASATNSVYVRGYSFAGDGGGGLFIPTNTVSGTNFGTLIAYSGANGWSWLRTFTGPMDVRWFGAKGDGISQDYLAFSRALQAIGSSPTARAELYIPPGVYLLTNSLPIPFNTNGDAVVIRGIQPGNTSNEPQYNSSTLVFTNAGAGFSYTSTNPPPGICISDLRIICAGTTTNAIRVGALSNPYANFGENWDLRRLMLFGPGETVAGTCGLLLCQLAKSRIEDITIAAFETGLIDGEGTENVFSHITVNNFKIGIQASYLPGSPPGDLNDRFEFCTIHGPSVTGGDHWVLDANGIHISHSFLETSTIIPVTSDAVYKFTANGNRIIIDGDFLSEISGGASTVTNLVTHPPGGGDITFLACMSGPCPASSIGAPLGSGASHTWNIVGCNGYFNQSFSDAVAANYVSMFTANGLQSAVPWSLTSGNFGDGGICLTNFGANLPAILWLASDGSKRYELGVLDDSTANSRIALLSNPAGTLTEAFSINKLSLAATFQGSLTSTGAVRGPSAVFLDPGSAGLSLTNGGINSPMLDFLAQDGSVRFAWQVLSPGTANERLSLMSNPFGTLLEVLGVNKASLTTTFSNSVVMPNLVVLGNNGGICITNTGSYLPAIEFLGPDGSDRYAIRVLDETGADPRLSIMANPFGTMNDRLTIHKGSAAVDIQGTISAPSGVITNTLRAGFLTANNLSSSTLIQTDGTTNLVSLANQANSVLVNNGSNPYWFAGKTTNINVLCEGGVTNQFQFVSGVLSNIVSVP